MTIVSLNRQIAIIIFKKIICVETIPILVCQEISSNSGRMKCPKRYSLKNHVRIFI